MGAWARAVVPAWARQVVRGQDQMWRGWIERAAAQVHDLDSYAVLGEYQPL